MEEGVAVVGSVDMAPVVVAGDVGVLLAVAVPALVAAVASAVECGGLPVTSGGFTFSYTQA